MPKANLTPIPETVDYAPNQTTSIALPTSGYITHLNATLEMTVNGLAAPVPAEDAPFRIIKAMRITAAGSKNYFEIVDGRQLMVENVFKYGTNLRSDALPGAGVTKDVITHIPIHFGLQPDVLFDKSVVLPAVDLNNLIFQVTWGNNNDLGVDFAIVSAKIRITPAELVIGPKENIRTIFPNGLIETRMESRILNIGNLYSNLSLVDEIPIGDTINQTSIMVLNAASNRSQVDISEVGIRFTKDRSIPYRLPFNHFTGLNQAFYGLDKELVGAGMIDWSHVSLEKYGRNASYDSVGDVVVGFTADVIGGQVYLLHKSIGKYKG